MENDETNSTGHEPLSKKFWLQLIFPNGLTFLAIVIGVWQFTVQQGANSQEEFKRKILEKKMSAYTDLADVVAKLVTTTDTTAFRQMANTFDEHYWGKLPLVTDSLVELAAKSFRSQVIDRKNGIVDVYDPEKLQNSGFSLIKTCQESLKKGQGK